MNEVGVRELKNQATEIIREVREQQAEYIITYRGKPVARIVPFAQTQSVVYSDSPAADERVAEAPSWEALNDLRQEIAKAGQGRPSALETLLAMRRERDESLRKSHTLDNHGQRHEAQQDAWRAMDWLRQEIARQWKTDLTAVEAVDEQRR
jgi:prevent-host-death family protein